MRRNFKTPEVPTGDRQPPTARPPADVNVTLTVPRAVVEEIVARLLPRPITVTQDTCMQVFGIKPRRYLELARKKAFPVYPLGDLRIASTEDVERALRPGADVVRPVAKATDSPAPGPAAAIDEVDAALIAQGRRIRSRR